jgi:hypothetical protein
MQVIWRGWLTALLLLSASWCCWPANAADVPEKILPATLLNICTVYSWMILYQWYYEKHGWYID